MRLSTVFRRPLRTVLLAGVVVTLSGFGWFHNSLKKSLPADKSTVTAPKEIRLWFAEKPEPNLSSITLLTADSTAVATSKVRKTDDPLSIAVDVTGAMAPGGYIVRWRTAGDDGHVIRGSYRFTVGR